MIYQRIHYFIKTAEEQSISKAANRLYISPQGLNKQISILETELNGSLFERSVHGIQLTEFGQYVYSQFWKLDEELHETIASVKNYTAKEQLQLKVGIATDLPQNSFVLPLISYMLERFPQYQINIKMLGFSDCKQQMKNGTVDLLFSNIHEEEDWSDYVSCHLEEQIAKIIVSKEHPWKTKDSITVTDMRKENFIKMDVPDARYTVPTGKSFFNTVPCRYVRKVPNFETMYALVQQCEGFAIFTEKFVYMQQAELKAFHYPERDFRFWTAMIYDPANPLSGLTTVINELKNHYFNKNGY